MQQNEKSRKTSSKMNTGHMELAQGSQSDNESQKIFPEGYEINLSDFALFLSVMKVKEAYTDVLSIILDEPDLKLKEVKAEQVILNRSGKRAIRLDAWAQDIYDRQFDMEMQNDISGDNVCKRSRLYQSMLDTPLLKSGRKTRYRHLPSTVIIFITQEDIFGKDLAMYTFREQCAEVPELLLEDGTSKIFLNMMSRNGRPELVSLLQYMKHTTLENADISVMDKRILHLDSIVEEVKQTEEWEVVKMGILEIGLEKGRQEGIQQGNKETLVRNVESVMKNFNITLQKACDGLGITIKEYEEAKAQIALLHKG